MKSCLRQEYNLVDAQLNKAYGEAYRYIEQVPRTGVKKPDTEQLNLLKKSQRAWLDFRDKECELILSNEDVQDLSDPYSESEWLSCMIIQTNTRTRQLQLYHNSEDFYPSPLTRG
ncbi:lysozyme inhibitor LprI family protein [Escherichia coli]